MLATPRPAARSVRPMSALAAAIRPAGLRSLWRARRDVPLGRAAVGGHGGAGLGRRISAEFVTPPAFPAFRVFVVFRALPAAAPGFR